MPKLSERQLHERRQHILDTAFELFTQKGYHATGMRDIMQAAELSKGGIYVHFESKASILEALLIQFDSERHAIKENLVSNSIEEAFAEYLRQRLRVFQVEKNRKWAKVLLAYWSFPHDIQMISDEKKTTRYQAYKRNITDLIQQGIDQGVFSDAIDLDAMAYQIMSTINGVAVMAGVMGHPISDDQIEHTVHMYLAHLKGGH